MFDGTEWFISVLKPTRGKVLKTVQVWRRADFDYFCAVDKILNFDGWPQFAAIKKNFTVHSKIKNG